jgi:hypothetical protein
MHYIFRASPLHPVAYAQNHTVCSINYRIGVAVSNPIKPVSALARFPIWCIYTVCPEW